MIIVMSNKVTQEQLDHLQDLVEKAGLKTHISKGTEKIIVLLIQPHKVLQS